MSEEIKKNEEVSENTTTEVETANKKQTWLNRIWSAIVGAAVAVGAMFGVTQPQIEAQKAKVIEVKTYATEALEAIKKGDVQTATAKLQEVTAATKEVAEQIKKDVEKVKEADKKSVVETVKKTVTESLVKDQVKKVETKSAQYNEPTVTEKPKAKEPTVNTTTTSVTPTTVEKK